ncbi:hypothetical protein FGO68_gene14622 [Halteria grandinella]|uniref:Uncharacterized protein n=1 Tax=Halteria grandinella TaxID=5974 RepID=A0A8J8NIH5_HALGN|nr:hypothetical protein FGO68_gene14622 [Halteria grandinella]
MPRRIRSNRPPDSITANSRDAGPQFRRRQDDETHKQGRNRPDYRAGKTVPPIGPPHARSQRRTCEGLSRQPVRA